MDMQMDTHSIRLIADAMDKLIDAHASTSDGLARDEMENAMSALRAALRLLAGPAKAPGAVDLDGPCPCGEDTEAGCAMRPKSALPGRRVMGDEENDAEAVKGIAAAMRGVPLDDVMATLPAAEREAVERHARRLIRKEYKRRQRVAAAEGEGE